MQWKGTQMLGERNDDIGAKTNGAMRFVAKLPVKVFVIVFSSICSLIGIIVLCKEAAKFFKRYLGFP